MARPVWPRVAAPEIIGAIAGVATALTVLVAVIFGFVQIRQVSRHQESLAAMELIRAAHDKAYEENWPRILALPDGLSAEEIRMRGLGDAANAVQYYFETMGVLVYHRAIPLAMFDHAVGGSCRASWRKLERYVRDQRAETRFVNFAEWFQWLAEQLDAHPEACKSTGAHVGHRDWSP